MEIKKGAIKGAVFWHEGGVFKWEPAYYTDIKNEFGSRAVEKWCAEIIAPGTEDIEEALESAHNITHQQRLQFWKEHPELGPRRRPTRPRR
ncbi:hypothetical protein TEQG_08647 [Trichophyton equinum CBS 127.97]|uniref:Uncharacterized protein n=1 Tax=Trichophyton equinum (strain ATCC MYA-4606 / CBS 127.97) TaxID=559882 RepID=F2PQ84_TRIEC|nr:hypothetical protein TEQG_08647 [Trichophyton equinum CBS 127.97]